MITELKKRRYNLKEIGLIDDQFYENIFNVYKVDKHYIYNILRKVGIPDTALDERYFYNAVIHASVPWTAISYQQYNTIKLWWLLCIVNKIINPVVNVEAGTIIRVLHPEYISDVLAVLRQELG